MGLTFPLSPIDNLKFDANNNVLSVINAQSVLSHQTGLSGTPSTANAPVTVGSAIQIVNNGSISVAVAGHVSAGLGSIRILRTRNSVTDIITQDPSQDTTTVMNSSLFTDNYSQISDSYGIGSTSRMRLNKNLSTSTSLPNHDVSDLLVIDALIGDEIQFQVSNNTANDTTYIDDLVVIQQ